MKKITIPSLQEKKSKKKKIKCLTAYDAIMAKILDDSGVDIILVGDSLGMVVQGKQNTLSVTMNDMKYHTRIVASAVSNALVIADMPFLSYHGLIEDAVLNAGSFLQECGADAVKVEGGEAVIDIVYDMVELGIPVMGHVGLTPQKVKQYGGFKTQGKTTAEAKTILTDAKLLEEAGTFAIIAEGIPAELGKKLAKEISVPIIGIGAGPYTDGQILVINDLIGLTEYVPGFAKQYCNMKEVVSKSVAEYMLDIDNGKFPVPPDKEKDNMKHLKSIK
ncbi:MAG: 3-methyl-2-oxobutanoate hydroxymethyltransferase [Nitrospinae bacterium]|nr:3-methyl-2-oxobutanoate hydroxymethyltransferase [Nitrospinota bacterium]